MKWADMLIHVLPSVNGCPDELAVDHLVKAARAMCSRSLVWNYSTLPILATAALAKYTLQIGQGQELVRLLSAEVNGALYAVPGASEGRRQQRQKTGQTCVLVGNNDFTLEPAPYLTGHQIITDIAVKPAMADPADWPDDLEEFVTDLAQGAVGTLCALPKTTWADVDTARMQTGLFNARVGEIAFKVARGFGRSRRGASIRWF